MRIITPEGEYSLPGPGRCVLKEEGKAQVFGQKVFMLFGGKLVAKPLGANSLIPFSPVKAPFQGCLDV